MNIKIGAQPQCNGAKSVIFDVLHTPETNDDIFNVLVLQLPFILSKGTGLYDANASYKF